MTLKPFLRDAAGDLARFVAPHFRKWTTQIGGLDLMVVFPTLFMLLGFVDARIVLGIAFLVAALKFGAGLLPQNRVATYDPTTHYLVKRVKRTSADE